MNSLNNIIVQEYLESLKEDRELDALFPILLTLMGYRLIATPRASKGQSQYGKDIVAFGIDTDGIKKRFYFELKGESSKDIDSVNFNVKDGIRDSILEAKDTAFNDSSIPQFNSLPIKIVVVHNGILKENLRPQFEGFINNTFRDKNRDGEFERWDVYKLTELFSKYLFNEYLLTDEKSLKLFKKTLTLLDVPEHNFADFKELIDLQIEKFAYINTSNRAFKKFFATLLLLSHIIFHYCKENDNLIPAKDCVTYLVLKTWAWVLRNKLETKKPVIEVFKRILETHSYILKEYFDKTLPIAKLKDGLSGEGGFYMELGYPNTLFEYLNYLIYYFKLTQYLDNKTNIEQQIKILKEVINNNEDGLRPLVDNHSIAVLNIFIFLRENSNLVTEDEIEFFGNFLEHIFNNIILTKKIRGRFPETYNNWEAVIDYVVHRDKPYNYEDNSTLLITTLFEILVVLGAEGFYSDYRESFDGKINLQTFYPNFIKYDIEQLLFEKEITNEGGSETSIKLDEKFDDFSIKMKSKENNIIEYRTDKAGLGFLRYLGHIYYKTPFFVNEWRRFYVDNS